MICRTQLIRRILRSQFCTFSVSSKIFFFINKYYKEKFGLSTESIISGFIFCFLELLGLFSCSRAKKYWVLAGMISDKHIIRLTSNHQISTFSVPFNKKNI